MEIIKHCNTHVLLGAGFSPQSLWFSTRYLHMKFMVDEVALERISFPLR
jgi:hypothetical protein